MIIQIPPSPFDKGAGHLRALKEPINAELGTRTIENFPLIKGDKGNSADIHAC
jgi:hypothetical protein